MNKYLWIIVLVLLALLYNWLYMPFEDKSEYQNEYTVMVSPLASPTPTPTPTPTPRPKTTEEMMKSLEYGEVVWATYGHESGYGKHDSCRAIGKYNGFGYKPLKTGGYTCYDSLEEVATEVSNWFVKKLEQYTIRQALCIYVGGYKRDESGNVVLVNDCEYASVTMQMMGGAK